MVNKLDSLEELLDKYKFVAYCYGLTIEQFQNWLNGDESIKPVLQSFVTGIKE